jgi:hypothetical protein
LYSCPKAGLPAKNNRPKTTKKDLKKATPNQVRNRKSDIEKEGIAFDRLDPANL